MKLRPGPTLPDSTRRPNPPAGFYWQQWRGLLVLRRKPRRSTKPASPLQQQQRDEIAALARALNDVAPWDRAAAEAIAWRTQLTWRDVMVLAMTGRMVVVPGMLPAMSVPDLDMISTLPGSIVYRSPTNWLGLPPAFDGWVLTMVGGMPLWRELPTFPEQASAVLDQLGTEPGDLVFRDADLWTILPPGINGQVLACNTITHQPEWVNSWTPAITELHGDVIAGPGDGDQEATLSDTGVTADTYDFASITVDAKGRITDAATGTPPAYINELHGDVVAGPGDGDQEATLSDSGVTAGTYTNMTGTVDAKGRLTAASSGSAGPTPVLAIISTQSAVSVSNVAWTGLTQQKQFLLRGAGLRPGTVNGNLRITLGTGSTPTYIVTGYIYSALYHSAAGAGGAFDSEAGTSMLITGNLSSTAGWSFVRLVIDTDNATYASFEGEAWMRNNDGHMYHYTIGGLVPISAPITAVKVDYTVGSHALGELTLYSIQQ